VIHLTKVVLRASCFLLLLAAVLFTAAVTSHGQNIRREYWLNLPGGTVANLTSSPNFPNNPSGVDFPTLFEGPTSWAEDYGSRLRGYVHPLSLIHI
jgi:hypothetical protein